MGRKSTKEEKSIYQLSREASELTREAAAEAMHTSSSRIEKLENGSMSITPEDIVAMAECYKDPSLCNYYCTHDCELGKAFVPEVKSKELSQITLELLSTLNKVVQEKDSLIDITADGDITEDEYEAFQNIQDQLTKMSMAIDTLQLWVDKKIGDGRFNGRLSDKE